MENKMYTVKEYAAAEKITVAGIYLRIKRGTLLYVEEHGIMLVFAASDKTIKKPRSKNKTDG